MQSVDGRLSQSLNPATGKAIGEFCDAGNADALMAIEAAHNARKNTDWAHKPRLREQVLLEFASLVQSELPNLARLLSEENGKLLVEAECELHASVSELKYYAGLSRNIFGRTIELEPGLFSSLHREPLGVAGIIVPWNAPIILLIRSLAPALAAGCTTVVKIAPQTALVSNRVFELLSQVEQLPSGVVNAFTETGSEGAQALVSSMDVDVISYTGSTEVGKRIMAAGANTLKRMNLELGGSAPCIVFEDADIEYAAAALVKAGMFMAGQYCCSATRLLVQRGVLQEMQNHLASLLSSLKLGPGLDPASQMGPLIDAAGQARVMKLLKDANKTDEILCDCSPVEGGEGFFLTPGLIYAPDKKSVFYREEVFGPLLVIDGFDDEDEAIAKANDTRYGLAASVWSSDLRKSQRVANALESGTVWINSHGRTFPEIENGGYKESGIGRLHGVEGLSEFLQTKHISYSTSG